LKNRITFLVATFFLSVTFITCNNFDNDQKIMYHYNYKDLLLSDSVRIKIINRTDTSFEAADNVEKDASKSIYLFDKKSNLMFYGFYINDSVCHYSESFNYLGMMLERKGKAILECGLFQGQMDTVIFNISIPSLQKKYQDIELLTNFGDTIRPELLFKNESYSNVKIFPFKLNVKQKINELVIFSTFKISDSISSSNYTLRDTLSFLYTKLLW